MARFIADEDFNGRIYRGLLFRKSDLEIVRVQDVGLSGASDDKLLEWATDNGRILFTHDARTMPRHVRDLLQAGASFPGVFIVDDLAPIGVCIDDLLLSRNAAKRASGRTKLSTCR
jgi:hypothetical protein